MSPDPLYHSILATDVEKSGSRNDNLLLRMRADLWQILTDTLTRQGIDVDRLTTVDDGDGFRFLLPADVPSAVLIEPFISRLGIELRQHREAASAKNHLRLRLALHAGLLYREQGTGTYTGVPMKDCARLLDAQAGRDLLAGSPGADMVVLLTDSFYQSVIAGGTSLDPAWFQRIPIQVKETARDGWAYVPGGVPTGEPAPSQKPKPPKQKPKSSKGPNGVRIDMRDDSSIRTVIGGDYHA